MGYSDYLRALLRPMDIYDLTPSSLSGAELEALGRGLDDLSQRLDYVERESALATAEGEGLEEILEIPLSPEESRALAASARQMEEAIASLGL